jgi:amino-acid N-acetyltransferase
MTDSITYRFANQSDFSPIKQLLILNKLPFEDIQTSKVEFIIATKGRQIIGRIGIENKRENGLLRSFAVADECKNMGIGTKLYDELIKYAQFKEIHTLHLLTTTAQKYFRKKGFMNTERKNAPIEIRKTTEFSSICPSSSAYMTLILE